MTGYNYYDAVKDDVKQYIEDNGLSFGLDAFDDESDMIDYIENEVWCADSVTGNGSGSYTFNSYIAEENLSHNWELIQDMAREYELDLKDSLITPEYIDVSLRCYVLDVSVREALVELGYIH